MASHHSSQDDEMIHGINITPMVDVMLVLLVIFMIAAPAIYNGSIKIQLPVAKSREKSEKTILRFNLLKDGKVLFNNKEIRNEDLPELIKKSTQGDPDPDALVAADKALTHGAVVEFIDRLKQSGVQHFAIAVDAPSSK